MRYSGNCGAQLSPIWCRLWYFLLNGTFECIQGAASFLFEYATYIAQVSRHIDWLGFNSTFSAIRLYHVLKIYSLKISVVYCCFIGLLQHDLCLQDVNKKLCGLLKMRRCCSVFSLHLRFIWAKCTSVGFCFWLTFGKISLWCTANQLSLSPDKTCYSIFGKMIHIPIILNYLFMANN